MAVLLLAANKKKSAIIIFTFFTHAFYNPSNFHLTILSCTTILMYSDECIAPSEGGMFMISL